MARTPTQPGKAATSAARAKKSVDPAKGDQAAPAASKAGAPTAAKPGRQRPFQRYRQRFNSRVGRPTVSYYWIIGTTVALTLIGRMTVLSASTAETISQGKDPYDLFIKESGFAALGLLLMFVLSCMPATFWKKAAPFLFLLAVVLLVLIFGAHHLPVLLAVVSHLVGLFAQRWLFFAEAEHVVGLYYGAHTGKQAV